MDLASLLLLNVGKKASGWLLKQWLGDVTGDISAGISDGLLERIRDVWQRKRTARMFEDLGEEVARNLLSTFETEQLKAHNNERFPHVEFDKVTEQIGLTLSGEISADLLLRENLDPERLTQALRIARPLPDDTELSKTDAHFYDRVLAETARYLVAMAYRLPRFQEQSIAALLDRMDRMRDQFRESLASSSRLEQGMQTLLRRTDVDLSTARFEIDYRNKVRTCLPG